MFTTFKVQCRIDIEATIHIPPTRFYLINELGGWLYYSKEGKKQTIDLPADPIKFAAFFKKHRVIDRYDKADGKMYRNNILTTTGPKGQPVLHKRLFEVKREEIILNPAQVQTIVAEIELSRNKYAQHFIKAAFGGVRSPAGARVIAMKNHKLQRTAA